MVARVLISGFVQGVGYRRFVKHNANKLGINGWVKNLPDNRVEALLSGPKILVEKMISICEKGPFLSEIKDVRVSYEDTKTVYKSFDIIF